MLEQPKPFQFKQGLDERLLTDEKCELLFQARYDGDYIFAFDNLADYDLVVSRMDMIRRHTASREIKFYVLCGFESIDSHDIMGTFKRVAALLRHGMKPYIMRYQNAKERPCDSSEWHDMYVTLARWCNKTSFIKTHTFREFCERDQSRVKTPGFIGASMRALRKMETEYPSAAKEYFDIRFEKAA